MWLGLVYLRGSWCDLVVNKEMILCYVIMFLMSSIGGFKSIFLYRIL